MRPADCKKYFLDFARLCHGRQEIAKQRPKLRNCAASPTAGACFRRLPCGRRGGNLRLAIPAQRRRRRGISDLIHQEHLVKHIQSSAACAIAAVLATPAWAGAADAAPDAGHAVFVMTNSAQANEVIAYERTPYGTLQDAHHYTTQGRGSGGKVDPLASQGSLTLSADKQWLFAVNAGSGTVSAFHVDGSRLKFADKIATGGSEPVSVTQHENLVFVLNTGGSSSVVGFYFEDGKFAPIQDSIGYLSGNAVGAGSVAFGPSGKLLLATEKATNSIDVFHVLSDGTLSALTNNTDVGPGTFSATFAGHGLAIVAQTGPSAPSGGAMPNASGLSSYAVQPDGTLKAISSSVPTQGTAACWEVVTGNYVYVANSASSTIAGFAIGAGGALRPLPGTIVATLGVGSIDIDMAASTDGKFLYTLNTGNGSVGEFAIDSASGALTPLGTVSGLPAASGLNGIAAN
jgi:6-phosphogluconolactonase